MIEDFNPSTKIIDEEGNEIEFEIIPLEAKELKSGTLYQQDIDELDRYISKVEKKAQKLDRKVDLLTNNADGLDYSVAVASGVLAGLLDVFFVGELNLKECSEWGSEKVNSFIKRVAGENGDDPDALKRAINRLANKSKPYYPSDPNLNDFGGGGQHHLKDFAHHPTLIGLLFSILTQFTKMCYGTDAMGRFIVVPVKDLNRIGDTVWKKLVYAIIYWFLHLVSDMAGTGEYVGNGTGLPGPILSLAKELSVLPPFSLLNFHDGDTEITISELLLRIFDGRLFADYDEDGGIIKERVDFRTEIGILEALKTQALPVLLNELIVRVFYSVRRLIIELKEHHVKSFSDLLKLDWRKIIPFKNRTLARMLTISSGTFMAVDMGDAAIRAFKNAAPATTGGPVVTSVAFVTTFLLRVNYVGVGRFAVAVVSDGMMGMEKAMIERQRVVVYNELLSLTNAKLCYKQVAMLENNRQMLEKNKEMWSSAKETSEAIMEAYKAMVFSMNYMSDAWEDIIETTTKMTSYFSKIEEKNPGLMNDLFGRSIDKLR